MSRQQISTGYQYPFPNIPSGWSKEGKTFANGLRELFDILFSGTYILKQVYPVGTVYLSANASIPFTFGKWEAITTGITGVYGWRRKS